MVAGPEERSRRAHDTADAHRRVAEALRSSADASRRVAQAFAHLAEVERLEADADPDGHTAATRRHHAGLSDLRVAITASEAETITREADTEQSHADAAEARSVAAQGGSIFEGE